jgi:hypothetical protein
MSWRRVNQQSHWNEAEEKFAEASRRTHAEVADLIAEYAVLKTSSRLTKDGEVIDRKKANRKEEELKAAIKQELIRLGETEMAVEGSGVVRLRDMDNVGYRLDALSPAQLASLVSVLTVKRTEVTEGIEGSHMRVYKPEWQWLREFEVRGRGAVQLLFEEPR